MVSREIGKLRDRIEKVKGSLEYIPKSRENLKKELYEIGEKLEKKEEKNGATLGIIWKEHKFTKGAKKMGYYRKHLAFTNELGKSQQRVLI